jgi:Mg2+/Co2+ transporter CorB
MREIPGFSEVAAFIDQYPLATAMIALLLLLVGSSFFSIAETAMMAVNRFRLRHLVKTGNRAARRTHALLSQTEKLLGVILLGNNLLNVAAATLVTVVTVQLFGTGELVLAVSSLAITFALLVFCEITPKVIGASYPERIALPISGLLVWLMRVMYPMVWFVNLFVTALLRLFRIKPAEGESHRLSVEELRTLVLEASHFIPKKHFAILTNLFDLERITVEDVMTPRAQIEAIDLELPLEQVLEQIATSHHTRLLVYRGDMSNVAGTLHLRRVLRLMRDEELTADRISELLVEPYYIPASTPVYEQLQYFQETRRRVGLVVDEYGEVLGLATIEDIVEELVGEFTTTTPRAGVLAWSRDGSFTADGAVSLRELNRKLGLNFPLSGPKTLNGLILEFLQDIPEAGVSLKLAEVPLEIVQTQDRVIKTVKLYRPPNPQPAEAQ